MLQFAVKHVKPGQEAAALYFAPSLDFSFLAKWHNIALQYWGNENLVGEMLQFAVKHVKPGQEAAALYFARSPSTAAYKLTQQ